MRRYVGYAEIGGDMWDRWGIGGDMWDRWGICGDMRR